MSFDLLGALFLDVLGYTRRSPDTFLLIIYNQLAAPFKLTRVEMEQNAVEIIVSGTCDIDTKKVKEKERGASRKSNRFLISFSLAYNRGGGRASRENLTDFELGRTSAHVA